MAEGTQPAVPRAEALRPDSDASRAADLGQLMGARERYKAVTGQYPGKLAPLPKLPAIPKTLEEAKALAERGHPLVIQAQHQVTAADLNVKIAATAFGPTLSGSVDRSQDMETGITHTRGVLT